MWLVKQKILVKLSYNRTFWLTPAKVFGGFVVQHFLVFFSSFLVLSSLYWLWVSVSAVLIRRFQPHKALDEFKDCNFQFYSVVRLRIYLSNHNPEKFLLTGNKSANLNTTAFTKALSGTSWICRQAYLTEVPKISEGYFSSIKWVTKSTLHTC